MGLHGFHLDALMVKKVVRRAEVPVDGPDELLFCFGGRCDIALNLDTVPIRQGHRSG